MIIGNMYCSGEAIIGLQLTKRDDAHSLLLIYQVLFAILSSHVPVTTRPS